MGGGGDGEAEGREQGWREGKGRGEREREGRGGDVGDQRETIGSSVSYNANIVRNICSELFFALEQ